MARNRTGRHRAPGFNPINELGDIAVRSAQPAMKASAVVVASGGLVAAFAIPASAASSRDQSDAGTVASQPLAPQAPGSDILAVAAPALSADAAPAFGYIGFSGKPAEPPPPPPAPAASPGPAAPAVAAAAARASRAATRPSVAPAPPRAVAAPARVAVAPAPVRPAPVAPPPAPKVVAPASTGGIIAIAASLSGIPYRYGGTTTSGFDCSGFTGYVYARAGKSIPRTAEAQRAASVKVSNPVPGDLVFFGYPAYHVGIYAGPGQLYDAQRTGTFTGLHSIWTMTNVSFGRF